MNDRRARLVLTPLFGLAIPNLAGLIDHRAHSWLGLALSYAWFVAVATATWEGNLRLYFRFQDRAAWLTRPWHRVRLLVGLICLFTVPFVTVALALWVWVSGDPSVTWRAMVAAVVAVVGSVTFVTHVYETVFLVRDWESDRLGNERLRRENLEAELEALRSEVNPHTLFNNLNALSHLVETGSPRAQVFLSALAESYRYLLRTRSRRLVPLADELALLDQFVALVTIRTGGGLSLCVQADPVAASRWMIPPVVLPELLENAVKHNALSESDPLVVTVRLERGRLVISHPLRPRTGPVASTGTGLPNLAQRFLLVAEEPAQWGVDAGQFVVRLPLVSKLDAGR